MSWSGFFYPDPDPSLSIFSICRYRVPIRYLVWTNIFLDNTAALKNNVLASKLFLSGFFYFVETKYKLSYGSSLFCLCYYNIGLHLPCVSRWVCDAALWQQTLVYKFLTLPREITLLIYFTCVQHLLDCLFYMLCCMRPTKLVHIPARCNSKVE